MENYLKHMPDDGRVEDEKKGKNCELNGRESLKRDLRKEKKRQQKHLIRFLMKQTIVKLFNSSERKKKDFSILI